jgi:hypothetical protein
MCDHPPKCTLHCNVTGGITSHSAAADKSNLGASPNALQPQKLQRHHPRRII